MKKYSGYIIFICVCLVLALFFAFALIGYKFLALCFMGLAALSAAFMGLRALGRRHERGAARLRRCLIALIVLGGVLAAVTEGYIISAVISSGRDTGGERFAVVLGAGVNGSVPSRSLRVRLDAALEYAGEHPEARLILSGGRGRGEDISEAQCMYDWLTARGVEPERLIMEDQASTTEENLRFSRNIIEELEPGTKRVCVITAGYHIARAKLMARDAGFEEVTARGASTGMPILELNYYLRECAGIWFYLITR